MLTLSIPEHIVALCGEQMKRLMDKVKAEDLWVLGHLEEIGGRGLPYLDGLLAINTRYLTC